MSGWTVALLAATGVHAGFQAVVTVLVYPALAEVPAGTFAPAHDAHSRRITPLVVVVYAAALVTCVGAVLAQPRSVGTWVAVSGTGAAFAVTALVAAPTHGRLGRERTDALVGRLLLADRARLLGAVVALAGALMAA